MNSKETSIPNLINLPKIVQPTLKNEAKTVMLVDSSDSKNNKKKNLMKVKGDVTKKKVKEATPKGTCFDCGKDGHWRRNYCGAPNPGGLVDQPLTCGIPVGIAYLDTTLSCLIHQDSFMSKSNPTGAFQPYSKYYPRLCHNSP